MMKKIYLSFLFSLAFISTFSQNYTILGNASSQGGCNCYQLTPDAGNQGGAIFQNQTINLNNSFDFTFNVFLGCNGANGADGIVFVLTNNPNGLGSAGEYLGYGNGSNQPFSLGVEFDTWQNGNHGDPGYDHIGIESGGSVDHNVAGAVPALTSQANIDDCNWHTVRIVWDVATSTYSVYFDGVLRQQIVLPNMVATYFGGNPIVNWGWSGATGGGTNDQRVCVLSTSNWVAGTNYETCNTTIQFHDISTSSLGSVQSWAWTFGDGGTSNQQNPSHTYAATGTYNVTLVITDISGCTNTYTHTITINPPINITATVTPPLCNGGSNGNIAASSSGGFGPSAGFGGYAYSWSTGVGGATLLGTSAGTYILTVTDGICTSTAQFTVNQPTALTATTSHTDAPCGGNGTATITISGGTPPYSGINWAGTPASNGVAVSMPPGTWIADFHDANGCSALLQYTTSIASLPCGITSSVSVTNVSCFNGSNGTATLTIGGTTGTAVINWSNGGTGATITGLAAGTYTYNYSDSDPLHAFSGSVTVTQPGAAMTVSLTTIDMSCAATNDGKATASVLSGGVPPYTYTWSGGQPNNPVASNLSGGSISVTVTDANGCTASATGTVTGPPTLTLNISTVNDSCYQTHTGSALATPGGGNPPYTYFWNNISSAQNNLSLNGGTYTVTVTDNKGCTITGTATINEPTPFTHTPLVATNILCYGGNTGAISTSAAGGTPAYTYTWSPSGTGSNPTGLAAGQYNVTIQDVNRCQILDSVVLTQPASALTATTSHTDASCNGASDGTITITISGGTAPYSYQGTPIPGGTNTLPGLPANTYSGTVLDANNCSVSVSETVSQPAVVSATETHVNETCFGALQGSITLTPAGGTAPYTFMWSDGITTQNRTNIAAGNYTVTVTDQHNCTGTLSVTITQPAAPVLTVNTTNALCFGGNGSATASPTTGTAPFTYAWSAGGTTATITPPAGNYTVTVTDVNTCQQTATFTISQPTDITIAETHTNLNCFGDANGTITLTPSGGTGPSYTYSWNPNVTTTNQAGLLTAGTYTITVTDQNSCPKTIAVTLTQPAQPLSMNIQSNNISCFGLNNGSITVTPSGGTAGYTYTWNPNVSTTNSASSLSPNTYSFTVTDANACTITSSVIISQPNQPLTFNQTQSNLTCFHSSNGVATLNTNGGTFPYGYVWSPSVSTIDSATGLAAGTYNVTATDNNGCTNSASFTITEPTLLVVTETHVNVLCNGNATGSVTINASGATPGYTYTWNPNVSNLNSASNLTAGTYNVTVSDANNCSASVASVVTEPTLLTLTATPTAVLCNGGNTGTISAVGNGGTPTYTYTATNGSGILNSANGQFNNLIAGTYTLVVTDQNACTATTTTTTVTEPAGMTVLVDTFSALCYHHADGRLVVSVTGGVQGYNFTLSNGATNTTGIFNNLAAGSYTVLIADANGCTKTDSGVITEPDSVLVDVTPNPVEVKLGNDLQLNATTNQSGSVVYDWSPKFGLSCYDCPDPVFSGVYTQPYVVLVTNQYGCVGTFAFTATVVPNYDIFIPNAFTPNSDGVNDFWQLFGNMNAIKQVEVAVFNRWGEKVFESNDIYYKWDGTYKGEPAYPGVYTYIARFVWINNHSDAHYKGSITLLK
jgi:gliding motility-associated-like protein